jgi:putative phosphotransacetylase
MSPRILDRKAVERAVREAVLGELKKTRGKESGGTPPRLVVNASARHMHVTPKDLEILFGPGAFLNPHALLRQEGQFAAKETVTLIGPRKRLISGLRILGPVREYTQIELALTDAITLGIADVPVRSSGDIAGSPGAYVMGPAGMLELKEGVIRAAPHAHMGPGDAELYGVKDGEFMRLAVTGTASVTFDRVLVRVSERFKLEVHLDTDSANACDLARAAEARLFK